MNMEHAPLLEMRNIKKDFFGNQVLTDINLTLNEGQVLGLVGENGAGKSTLMKILFGASDISSTGGYGGDILLNGEKVSFSNPFDAIAAGIGMVHQEFSLIPGFEAEENILLNREPKKSNLISEIFGDRLNTLDRHEMDVRAEQAIEKMGVSIDRHMMISSMPVGHKQFTEIARELSKDQLKILILDEPTAVLTEKEAEALLESIRGMSERGIAVIFITHRLQEILAVCDTVAVMRDGVLVETVPAKETSVEQITHWMVGRSVDGGAGSGEVRTHEDAKTILKIEKLWVDMPGETVRNVSLEVKEGEILGIGGLAGQGKLGIPNGIMGLCEAIRGSASIRPSRSSPRTEEASAFFSTSPLNGTWRSPPCRSRINSSSIIWAASSSGETRRRSGRSRKNISTNSRSSAPDPGRMPGNCPAETSRRSAWPKHLPLNRGSSSCPSPPGAST